MWNRIINARAETVAERPGFRTVLRRSRCLVLADGFYEWRWLRLPLLRYQELPLLPRLKRR